jgi:hypothetical protein
VINNFNQIQEFCDFPDPEVYYFGQIIQRRKDNPHIGPDNIIIKDFYIYSKEDFDKVKSVLVPICDALNARAYIHLNKRRLKNTAFEMLEILSDRLRKEEYKSLKSIYATASGVAKKDSDKKWIIDLDGELAEGKNLNSVIKFIGSLSPVGSKVLMEVKTKNGVHLITKPFDSRLFELRYTIGIHKNDPTILYCPN